MDDQVLTCNNQIEGGHCRREIRNIGIVTTCSHIICEPCANVTGLLKADPSRRQCPTCKSPLPHQDDAVYANLNPTEELKTSILSGLNPSTVMECASRALAFWNYQIQHETMYQKHMFNIVNEKRQKLSNAMDGLVADANNQIDDLKGRIGTLTNDHADLQRRCSDMAAKDRTRTKKFNEMRQLYDTLKQRVLLHQQQRLTSTDARRAVESMEPETKYADNSRPVAPKQPLHHSQAYGTPGGVEQLHVHQRSGSVVSSDVAMMPPPQRPVERKDTEGPPYTNIQTSHRIPLPGAVRATANRTALAQQRDTTSNISVGVGAHQYLRNGNPVSASKLGVNKMSGGTPPDIKTSSASVPDMGLYNGSLHHRSPLGQGGDRYQQDTMTNPGFYY